MAKNITLALKPIPFAGTHFFSIRVLTNWFYLVLFFLFALALVNIVFGVGLSTGEYWVIGFIFSAHVYLFGFIGLVVTNALQAEKTKYPGWYWWLLPIIMYATFAWWVVVTLIRFNLLIESLFSSKKSKFTKPKYKMMFSPSKKDVERQKSKDFMESGGKELFDAQKEEEKELSEKHNLSQEDRNRLETLKMRQRIMIKMESNPGALLKDILSEDEMEEFVLILLEYY